MFGLGKKSDLEEYLNNEERSLEQRLKIVVSTFMISGLSSTKNKETILLWFQRKLLEEVLPEGDANLIYLVLEQCISNLTDLLLRPQLTDPVLKIILSSNSSTAEALGCSVEVLKNPHFLKYFVHDVEKLTDVVTSLVMKLISIEDGSKLKINAYTAILNAILDVKHNILHPNDLRQALVDHLLEILSFVADDVKKHNISPFEFHSFVVVVYQILFSDTEYRNAFLRNVFVQTTISDSDPEKHVFDLIKKLKEFPTYLKPDVLATAYSLILSAFLLSNCDDDGKFKAFVALCSFIYVRPLSINESHQKCVALNDNIVAVHALMDLLLKYDLTLEAKSQQFTFQEWLSSLIDVILDKLKADFSGGVLKLLEDCFKFSPFLIESSLKKLTRNVMLSKKTDEDVISAYSDLCAYVLDIHVKLYRVHKFISALLITIKETLTEFTSENMPQTSDVLPTEVFANIETAVTSLPSTVQNMTLLTTLLFHLENDCIHALEEEKSKRVDVKILLLIDIVTSLIRRFITGTRVADHSVPHMVRDKFISLMCNLKVLLGRFGKAMISKEHNSELAESFLHLCLVLGDMELVLMAYEGSPRKVTKQVGVTARSPTNLVYLHPYLSDIQWKMIAQRVVNFGGEQCVCLLNDLVLQKIHALPYLEDELQGPYNENVYDNGPAVRCATYLATMSHPQWLFSHVSEFVHLLKPADMLSLARLLVNYCQLREEEEIEEILSADFNELRTLSAAMLCYTFYKIGKKFVSYNIKEIKKVMRKIGYENILKVEMQDDEADSAVKSVEEVVNEISLLISRDFELSDEPIDDEFLEKDLFILLRLPVRYLHRENRSVFCLMSLLLMKNVIKLRSTNGNCTKTLTRSCKILQETMVNVRIPKSVDCGKVIAWLHRGLKWTSYCDQLMRTWCEVTQDHECGVDSVIEIVKNSHESEVDSSRSEGADLLTRYFVNLEKMRKRKRHSNQETNVKEKLKKLCYKNFDEVFRSVSEDCERREKQLSLYTLLLHEALKCEDEHQLNLLSVHLKDFFEFVEQSADLKSEAVSRFFLVVLKFNKKLQSWLPQDFFFEMWCAHCYVVNDAVVEGLLKVASVDEYHEMLNILLAHTEGLLKDPDEEIINSLCRLWRLVIETPVKKAKTKVKKTITLPLYAVAQKYTTLSVSHKPSGHKLLLSAFTDIFTSLLQCKQVPLKYEIIDYCFNLISYIVSLNCDEKLLLKCVEMLFVFCAARRSLVLDRIPSFYLCYKWLFIDLLKKSAANLSTDFDVMSSAAHKMEKLTDSLVKNRKDFTKTAISAIADFVSAFTEVHVTHPVKDHFKNIIYCWIDICDSHGVEYLSAAMSAGPHTVFKQFLSDYKKYYKFSGKI